MDNWYIASVQDGSADELLHMFWEFHDFRIIEVNYSASEDFVDVIFEYDDREKRVLLRFEKYVEFHVQMDDFENSWIFGATLHAYKDQIRWVNSEIESYDLCPTVTFFQGDKLKWAMVDKEGKTIPVPYDMQHQCFRSYNYKTKKREETYYHYNIIPE